jgi:hypothetical protein
VALDPLLALSIMQSSASREVVCPPEDKRASASARSANAQGDNAQAAPGDECIPVLTDGQAAAAAAGATPVVAPLAIAPLALALAAVPAVAAVPLALASGNGNGNGGGNLSPQ